MVGNGGGERVLTSGVDQPAHDHAAASAESTTHPTSSSRILAHGGSLAPLCMAGLVLRHAGSTIASYGRCRAQKRNLRLAGADTPTARHTNNQVMSSRSTKHWRSANAYPTVIIALARGPTVRPTSNSSVGRRVTMSDRSQQGDTSDSTTLGEPRDHFSFFLARPAFSSRRLRSSASVASPQKNCRIVNPCRVALASSQRGHARRSYPKSWIIFPVLIVIIQ